jgi:biopolymer transport protein TolQ
MVGSQAESALFSGDIVKPAEDPRGSGRRLEANAMGGAVGAHAARAVMNPPDVAVDLSIFELFKNAHIVVKLVMIGLVLASVWSWAIILEKLFLYAKTRKETDKFEQVFWSGQSLLELYDALSGRRNTGMAALFVNGMREFKRSTEPEGRDRATKPMPGVQLRVDKVMDVTISREVERLERRLTFLATVGSTAPFVGLFGTVWGIMTSFQAIAVTKNTSLAVVAPGIAEALFATALGLLAAIPAVIFYNKFNTEVARHAARLEGFADEFGAILSRQIDKTM